MADFVLASNNKKKIIELRDLMKDFENFKVMSLQDISFTGDIVEDGTSFEENSLIKASTPAKLGYIGIADDSGISVDALGGRPGIYSARYSGENATDEKNREKMFEEMKDIPEEDRTARYVCVVSMVLPENSEYVIPEEYRISEALAERVGIKPEQAMLIRGECEGYILREERGNGGFGYDPMFWFPEFGSTFAEVSAEMKASVSHRGKAMREFMNRIRQIFNV